MLFKYSTYTKIKNILRTFEPDNHKILRTSQPQKIFTGPYKKKECSEFIIDSISSFTISNILSKTLSLLFLMLKIK